MKRYHQEKALMVTRQKMDAHFRKQRGTTEQVEAGRFHKYKPLACSCDQCRVAAEMDRKESKAKRKKLKQKIHLEE